MKALLPAAVLALALAPSQPAARAAESAHDQAFHNARQWAHVLDDPKRDEWQKPHEVIQALALKSGDVVADIGAGTGYFSVRLAHMLPEGRVYAVDAEPDMVKYLGERAQKDGLANMRAVQATPGDAKLPERVDLVLFVDVYHHLHDRPHYLERLRGSLKPGARIAVIDFRPDSPVGPPADGRVAPDTVKSEMQRAGYAPDTQRDFLPYQYFLVFRAK
jgi:SAM-dependent methyltransferase